MQLTDTNTIIESIQQLNFLLNEMQKPLDNGTQNQLTSLIKLLKKPAESYTKNDLTQIAEDNQGVMQTLFLETGKSPELREKYQKIILSFTHWIAFHGGFLKEIVYPVTALAQMANTRHDKVSLEALYEIAAYMIVATDKNEQSSKTSSSWHRLIINYAIIATRTHNPDLMESAFKTLLKYFPESAPNFFQQGMSEMVRLNYPSHVRVVMKKYLDDNTKA